MKRPPSLEVRRREFETGPRLDAFLELISAQPGPGDSILRGRITGGSELSEVEGADRMRSEERLAEVCLVLAVDGARSVLARLEEIRRQSDQDDPPLSRFVEGLSDEHSRDLDVLEQLLDLRYRGAAEAAGVQETVSRAFPSFAVRFGEGGLDRDAALHFAELLEEEAVRFFRTMAEEMPDPLFRPLLSLWASRSETCLDRLRTALL